MIGAPGCFYKIFPFSFFKVPIVIVGSGRPKIVFGIILKFHNKRYIYEKTLDLDRAFLQYVLHLQYTRPHLHLHSECLGLIQSDPGELKN
jgi:hypothetical protein